MKLIAAILTGMMVVTLSSFTQAEMNLRPVHPDESAEYTYNKRFSLDEALTSLDRVRLYLESFRLLTEEAQGSISRKRLKEIGNTDWETQYPGFKNIPLCIEGTLRKQDYLIKKLLYESAKHGVKDGTVGGKALSEAKRAFEDSEKSFQTFRDNFGIAD